MSDQHSPLIKTWQQLVAVVVAAFVVPIVVIILIASLVTSGRKGGTEGSESALLARIQPVGTVALAPGPSTLAPAGLTPAAAGERSGADVVATVCAKCHESGAGGAPKIGDRPAWLQRAKRGLASVYESALKGHAGMPARGGMAELSDGEIRHAVEFMLNAGATTPATTTAAAVPAIPAAPAATAAAKPDGKKVFDTACVACHGTGVAGAPKLGDKANWSPRIAQGTNVLYDHALKGYQGKAGVMPPKGGNTALPDADVKAAVDYMAASAK
jgi:cytochrome c5